MLLSSMVNFEVIKRRDSTSAARADGFIYFSWILFLLFHSNYHFDVDAYSQPAFDYYCFNVERVLFVPIGFWMPRPGQARPHVFALRCDVIQIVMVLVITRKMVIRLRSHPAIEPLRLRYYDVRCCLPEGFQELCMQYECWMAYSITSFSFFFCSFRCLAHKMVLNLWTSRDHGGHGHTHHITFIINI